MQMANHFADILSLYPNASPIKQGGQKSVFLINHQNFGECILKLGFYQRPQSLERIVREVKMLREIDSPYYPKNFDFQILDGNRFLIIEQYIESTPLSCILKEYTDQEKVLTLLRELVLGLMIIWNKQVVHRDIKPDNILIKDDGAPVIIDLGIARLLDEESLTQTIAQRGPATPAYAAPEQLQNRKASIDFRTDQFILGIITTQLLMGGIHPFDPAVVGGGENIMENIIQGRWIENFFVKPNLVFFKPLVEKLLGKEPYMRFRSPELLMKQIENCLEKV